MGTGARRISERPNRWAHSTCLRLLDHPHQIINISLITEITYKRPLYLVPMWYFHDKTMIVSVFGIWDSVVFLLMIYFWIFFNVLFFQAACSPEEQIKSTAHFGSEWFSSARPNSVSLLTLITWRWLTASPSQIAVSQHRVFTAWTN